MNIKNFRKQQQNGNIIPKRKKKERESKTSDNKQTKKIVIGVVCATSLMLNVGGGVFFASSMNAAEDRYQAKITELQQSLDELGDIKQVYFVKSDIKAGTPVDISHLDTVSIPATVFSNEYITDPKVFETSLYKVELKAGTVLTKSVLTPELITQQDRFLDIVADVFPVKLEPNEFIDLHISTPTGQDYIVLGKKRVSEFHGNSCEVMVGAEDIHRYQSALVDAFLNPGTTIYATTYVEPGLQEASIPYYPVSNQALNAMEVNPNIVKVAEKEIIQRRRKILENSLNVNKVEQEYIANGREVVLEKLMADIEKYRALKEEAEGAVRSSEVDTSAENAATSEEAVQSGETGSEQTIEIEKTE